MGEVEKYKGFKAELAIAETYEQIKAIEIKAAAIAKIASDSKMGKKEQDEWGEFRVQIERKKGKWLKEKFRKRGTGSNQYKKVEKSETTTLADVGITKDESANARLLLNEENLIKEVTEKIKNSKDVVTPNKVSNEIRKIKKEEEKKKESEKRKKELEKYKESDYEPQKYPGLFQNVCKEFIDDNSIDHIITDPPYPEEFLKDWKDLSEVANRILKPGGFCICYSGKIHLPEVISNMTEHLSYYWQLILLHTGSFAGVHPVKINTMYKPILVFYKEPKKCQDEYITDIIHGTGTEKYDHEWQQAEDELKQILDRFTKEGDLILDPFAGSGTTGVCCMKNKRRSILIDKDYQNE